MRIVQPPSSSKGVQYIESPELVARLVEMQREIGKLRASSPVPIVQIKEVIVTKEVPSTEHLFRIDTLTKQVDALEKARLSRVENTPKAVSHPVIETRTVTEVVDRIVDKIVYKVPTSFMYWLLGSSVSSLLTGILIGIALKHK